MPVISYKALAAHLRSTSTADGPTAVTLIYGDSHLTRNAVQELIDVLLPASRRHTHVETVDAATEPIGDALERVNTYSLLPGPKIVVLANLQMSGAKSEKDRLARQCSEAYRKGDTRKAAGFFLRLLGLLDLTPADVARDTEGRLMPPTGHPEFDQSWWAALCDYCIRHDLRASQLTADTQLLQAAVEKGFPAENYLVLTAGAVDKRLQLFKSIEKNGTVIDCAVPTGERHADKKAQETVVGDIVNSLCAKNDKTIEPQAVRRLFEKTGFELQTVVNSVEKLIAYVGHKTAIGVADVEAVLKRTRKDPVYEFTNAIADRRVEDALFLLEELMAAGPAALRPEQVLVAMVNQIRRLLLAKEFAASPHGRQWQPGCSYPHFKQSVFPAVQAFDRDLIEALERWDRPAPIVKKSGVRSELILAANPRNPYPVFMLLSKSENYQLQELQNAYDRLYEADRRIKTGRDKKRLLLEQAVLSICRST